jgi:hypothetical protein
VESALELTGKDDLAEGLVPLFYYEDFSYIIDGEKRSTPLYFRKSELENDFKRENPDEKIPKTMVTELLSVLAEMVVPGGTDNDLKSLKIMTPKESDEKKRVCDKAGGKEAPFYIGQRIIIL